MAKPKLTLTKKLDADKLAASFEKLTGSQTDASRDRARQDEDQEGYFSRMTSIDLPAPKVEWAARAARSPIRP